MKLQIPKLTIKRPAFFTRKSTPGNPAVKLKAATARMRPGVDDDFDDEPQTRLSSAFFVVLILHVVAVGGIYAFNSIKAHRRGFETPTVAAKPAVDTTPATEPSAAPVKPHAGSASDLATKPNAAPIVSAPLATTPISNSHIYHVKPGDTLVKIAQQTGVSVAALQFANKDTATLHPGQILNVPAKNLAGSTATTDASTQASLAKKTDASAAPKPASTVSPTTYEVQKKDTATSIAKRFGVGVDDLLKLNKIADPTKLQLGQKLSIPAKKN